MKLHEWLIPLFVVITVFGMYLLLEALAPEVFGTAWESIKGTVWVFMPWVFLPWIIILTLAMYALVKELRRRGAAH